MFVELISVSLCANRLYQVILRFATIFFLFMGHSNPLLALREQVRKLNDASQDSLVDFMTSTVQCRKSVETL